MKITVAGEAFAVKSNIKKEDFDLVKKHKPEELKIIDKDGNEVFTVNYSEGRPSIESFGITFSSVSRDDDKSLTLTGTIPQGTADAKEYITDKIGICYENLTTIEGRMTEAVKGIKEARKKIKDSISG